MKLNNSLLIIEYPSINKDNSIGLINSLLNTRFYQENSNHIIVSTLSQGFQLPYISDKLSLVENRSEKLSVTVNNVIYIPFFQVRKSSHLIMNSYSDNLTNVFVLIVDDDITFTDRYFDVIFNSITLMNSDEDVGMVYHSFRRRKTKLAGITSYEEYDNKIHGRQECGLGQLMRYTDINKMYHHFDDFNPLPFGAGEDKFSMIYTKYNLRKKVMITYDAINTAFLKVPVSTEDSTRRLMNPSYRIRELQKTKGSMLNILLNTYGYHSEKDF